MIYLDTHAAVYLGAGRADKLGKEAAPLIDKSDLLLSPIVAVELQYLYEVGKIGFTALQAIDILQTDFRIRFCDLPFDRIVKWAIEERWTRDLFDRLIVAHARARGEAILLSRDRLIQQNYSRAIW